MFHNAINKKMNQITNTILMIEPVRFDIMALSVNNYYQRILDGFSPDHTQKKAV